ncbi:hypothetical protein Xmau_02865 [Xenorhabdus mauleonii]|uniref:KilA-N domain-containing protein n=1 Tax=Xenorhabdus mauleonii TaxID=351675 RepID=A0A1I3WPG6_9GAMM|nr:KilA-N domain-containing protein [Xenorhabdus mauleonii]PHM39261.1 hypothetical protein Xmau_02865 [Xenorhabdus mauleonii]SFK09418.1 KilA-N domain-containing protein [Xenorhabdus mauleonii]
MKQLNNKSKTPTAATIGASKSSVYMKGTNMNNIAPVTQAVTMSSREIAELTGKRHTDVIRDVWAMLEQLYELNKDDANLRHHKNQQVKIVDGVIAVIDNRGYVSEFLLDRRHTEILITGYDVKRRAAVIDRWFALESGTAKPQASQMPIGNIILVTDAMGRFKLSALRHASGESKSKRPSDWLKTKYAQEWIEDLSNLSSLGQDVITVHRNGIFAHEILAIEYAGWLNPMFQAQFKQILEEQYSRSRTVVETNITVSVNRRLPKGVYLQNSKTNPYRAFVYEDAQKISIGCYPTIEEAVDAQNLYFDTGEVKPIKRAPVRFNRDGQYLVTVTDGKVSHYEPLGERTVVDTEAYWRLRKDMNTVQGIMTEMATRMRFVHDERSIASFDYPINEIVSH